MATGDSQICTGARLHGSRVRMRTGRIGYSRRTRLHLISFGAVECPCRVPRLFYGRQCDTGYIGVGPAALTVVDLVAERAERGLCAASVGVNRGDPVRGHPRGPGVLAWKTSIGHDSNQKSQPASHTQGTE